MATSGNQWIGSYELVRRLGTGGMGEVWLAQQRGAAGFNRFVAVKRLLPQAMEQPEVVQMFIEEAQLTGRLRHPNIVNVIELGAATTGELHLVLEYVDGLSLHKLIRHDKKGLKTLAALVIARDLALALHAAHSLVDDEGKELGLVHRDVTPSNVMIDRQGHVKLMDFGIAKARAKTNRTEFGVIKGKFAYLAQEQVHGDVDHRSDLFSLGLVLWEMLAGRAARSADSDAALFAKVMSPVAPIESVVAGLHPAVADVVDKACSSDPEHRFQSGEEMAQALLAAMSATKEYEGEMAVRRELGELVRSLLPREDSGAKKLDRKSTDAEKYALTLHSLVLQQEGSTIARPLTPEILRSITPPKKRSGLLFAAVATLGAVAAISGAVFLRTSEQSRAEARTTTPAEGVPTPPVVIDAGPRRNAVVDAGATLAAINDGSAAALAVDAGVESSHEESKTRRRARRRTDTSPESQSAPDAPATLRLVVLPWGEATLDGRALGVSPFSPMQLAPGRHQIEIRNSRLQVQRTVTVRLAPGANELVRVDLTRGE